MFSEFWLFDAWFWLEDFPQLAIVGFWAIAVAWGGVADSVDSNEDDGFAIAASEFKVTPEASAFGFFAFFEYTADPPVGGCCDGAAGFVIG